jgi:hypothetical protein
MMNLTQIQRRIAEIKRQLLALGPLHPGSVSQQYNICGTPGCRCKDPRRPRKHGPYFQLSYTRRGRSSTRFVRPDQVAAIRQKVANHRRFRQLIQQWIDLAVESERLERAQTHLSVRLPVPPACQGAGRLTRQTGRQAKQTHGR